MPPGVLEAANEVLQPYLRVAADGSTKVMSDDGDAEIYGLGTNGLMFARLTGRHIWDVFYEVACAGNWAIMPAGCPACVPAADILAQVPDELREEALVVNSSEDVLRAVRRS